MASIKEIDKLHNDLTNNNIKGVEFFLNNLNNKDLKDYQYLYIEATEHNKPEIINLLLSYKELKSKYRNYRALETACHYGYSEIAKLLIFNSDYFSLQFTSYLVAIENNNIDIIEMFFNKKGFIPLHNSANEIYQKWRASKNNTEDKETVLHLFNKETIKEHFFKHNKKLYNEICNYSISKKINKF
jgi:hypothetical protein